MFYFVSKIVWFFLTPSNALVVLALTGFALQWTRHARAGSRLAGGAAAALLVAGLTPLGNALILPLEARFPAFVDDGTSVAGIVVIGGTFDTEATNAHGGGSEFTPDTTPEATLVEKTIRQLGLEPTRVIYERRSLNTFQNAVYAKELADPKPGERWLVITSAFHMPRTMGVFRTAGFAVVPYPVDYRTAGAASLLRPFAFVGEGLRRTDVAAKEWIGLAVYYLSGRTEAFFPAP